MVLAWNPSTREVEAERSQLQGQHVLLRMTPFQRKEEARGGEQGAEKSSQDGTAGRAVSWVAGQWQKGSLNPQISQNEGNESVTWDNV